MNRTVTTDGGLDLTGLFPEEQVRRVQGQLIDVTAPEQVEIKIDRRTGRVWVNVVGACMLRACQVKEIVVDVDGDMLVRSHLRVATD